MGGGKLCWVVRQNEPSLDLFIGPQPVSTFIRQIFHQNSATLIFEAIDQITKGVSQVIHRHTLLRPEALFRLWTNLKLNQHQMIKIQLWRKGLLFIGDLRDQSKVVQWIRERSKESVVGM